jgi:hypothetical protein
MSKNLSYTLLKTLEVIKHCGINAEGLVSYDNIFLASVQDLEKKSGIKNCIGLAYSQRNSIFFSRRISKIFLSDELNYPHLEAVLAHEIFHIYSSYNDLKLSKLEEEGSAELLAYYVYHKLGEQSSKVNKNKFIKNKDPVYGDGFRIVYKKAKMLGGIRNYFQTLVPNPKNISRKLISDNFINNLWGNTNLTKKDHWWISNENVSNAQTVKWWMHN